MIWYILAIVGFMATVVGISWLATDNNPQVALAIAIVGVLLFTGVALVTTIQHSSDFEERCEAEGGVVVDIYQGDDVCLKDEDVLIKE